MKIAMSVCVYYSLDHLFSQHGGVAHSNANSNVYMFIIPLITYFLDMERVDERNENCNVFMCILFPWSPISPTWMGCSQQWEFQCIYVYYSLDHLFSRHGGGSSQKWELKCLYVYIIPLITYFHKHGGGCSQKWELQCLYVYIIPLIPISPTWRGVAERNENCKICMRILFLWSPISTNMEGVAHRNENCNVCICILFPWSPIYPPRRELLREIRIPMSVCVYYSLAHVFPPNMEGVAHRNENCNVCMCIIFPW